MTSDTNQPALRQLPVKRLSAVELKSQSLAKRSRPSSNNSDHAADPKGNAPSPGNVSGSGGEDMVGSRRKKRERGRGLEGSEQAPKENGDHLDTNSRVATRSKRKALASVITAGRVVGRESDQGGGVETESGAKIPARLDDHDRVLAAVAAAAEGGDGSSSSGIGSDKCSLRETSSTVRERWVHVDPVEGAVDQASKVGTARDMCVEVKPLLLPAEACWNDLKT